MLISRRLRAAVDCRSVSESVLLIEFQLENRHFTSAKEVMFSPVSVHLSVCLLIGLFENY